MITQGKANEILNHLTGRLQSVASITAVYLGLSTTTPTADGSNVTEPVGNGYARVLLGNTSQALTQKMNAADDGEITNKEIIYFPEATGAWGSCTHLCFYIAVSGGTPFAFGALTTSISPTTNTIPIIRVDGLTLTLA